MDEEDSALAPKFIFTSTDLEVVEGSQVRINCRLTGRPAPEVKWFLNGQTRSSDARNRIMVNESGYNTLLILDTKLSDAGVVQCWAKNRSGEARFQVLYQTRLAVACLPEDPKLYLVFFSCACSISYSAT